MQVTLWLILGATVGLAALVSRNRERVLAIDLGPEDDFGDIQVRLPSGWEEKRVNDGERISLVATEPAENGHPELHPARRVIISLQPVPPRADGQPPSAKDYLENGFSVQPKSAEPIRIGDVPGILVESQKPVGRRKFATNGYALYACTILPNSVALTIIVEGVGSPGPSDRKLIRALAEGVRTPWSGEE
jgi:hypothetical protein